jgi:hypothetical protein
MEPKRESRLSFGDIRACRIRRCDFVVQEPRGAAQLVAFEAEALDALVVSTDDAPAEEIRIPESIDGSGRDVRQARIASGADLLAAMQVHALAGLASPVRIPALKSGSLSTSRGIKSCDIRVCLGSSPSRAARRAACSAGTRRCVFEAGFFLRFFLTCIRI